MELIAVAASAAELVAFSINIVSSIAEIRDRVRNAPQQYSEYQCQVSLLIKTARFIEKNSILHVTDVHCHLKATLIEAKTLESILRCEVSRFTTRSLTRNYLTVIKRNKQRKILDHLENLQRKKTALLLCLSAMHSCQLSSFEEKIDQLLAMTAEDREAYSEIVKRGKAWEPAEVRSRDTHPHLLDDHMSMTGHVAGDCCTPISVSKRTTNGSHNFGLIACSGNAKVSNGNTVLGPVNEQGRSGAANDQTISSGHRYKKIVITDDAKVHNGNIGPSAGHGYERIEAAGGTVKNGDFTDVATRDRELA